jgi:multidrug efflux pump subunit AcrA (membrane-fusion protein)
MASRRFLVISTIAVALAGVGAWYVLERGESVVKAAAPPLPVTVAIASKGDLPIYLSGLGTVQASFTQRHLGDRAQAESAGRESPVAVLCRGARCRKKTAAE